MNNAFFPQRSPLINKGDRDKHKQNPQSKKVATGWGGEAEKQSRNVMYMHQLPVMSAVIMYYRHVPIKNAITADGMKEQSEKLLHILKTVCELEFEE